MLFHNLQSSLSKMRPLWLLLLRLFFNVSFGQKKSSIALIHCSTTSILLPYRLFKMPPKRVGTLGRALVTTSIPTPAQTPSYLPARRVWWVRSTTHCGGNYRASSVGKSSLKTSGCSTVVRSTMPISLINFGESATTPTPKTSVNFRLGASSFKSMPCAA